MPENKFEINARSLLATPHFADEPAFQSFVETLSGFTEIHSGKSFDALCHGAIKAWADLFPEPIGKTSKFSGLLQKIETGLQGEVGMPPIKTPWGGVSISIHEPPFVEKYLVVKRGTFLSLETHAQKDEMLAVEEGLGLLLFLPRAGMPLQYRLLVPGSRAEFAPGQVHCIIGLENLLVYERSKDPLGMDRDIQIIYPPEAA